MTDHGAAEAGFADPEDLAVDAGAGIEIEISVDPVVTPIEIGTGPAYPGALDPGH